MKKDRSIQIQRLQENLSSLRKIAGWKAEDLGEMLGVSNQNISSLENGHTKLSKAQYIAIRHLLDYQAKVDPQNTTLPYITQLLVDRPELQGDNYNALRDVARNIAAATTTLQGQALRFFADALLQASYTRILDHNEIDGLLKTACTTEITHNWTADIFGEQKKDI